MITDSTYTLTLEKALTDTFVLALQQEMQSALVVTAAENFGTMTKPLHAGLAARSAILATRLAEQDFTCAPDAIEGKFGFMKVFGGTAPASYAKQWGQPLEILTETGIGLKAYPCCAATHPAIDATRGLREALKDNSVEDIESIRKFFGDGKLSVALKVVGKEC